jgi:hypothetical protein
MPDGFIMDACRSINKLRMRVLARMGIVVLGVALLFFIFSLVHLHIMIALFICFIVSLLLYVFIASGMVDGYKEQFRTNVVAPMVRQVNPSMEYCNDQFIGKIEFLLSGMNSNILERYWTTEHFTGTVGSLPVHCTFVNVTGSMRRGTSSTSDDSFGFMKGLLVLAGERGRDVNIQDCIAELMVIDKKWTTPENLDVHLSADHEKTVTVYKKESRTTTHKEALLMGKYQHYPLDWSIHYAWKPKHILASGNADFDNRYTIYSANSSDVDRSNLYVLIQRITEVSDKWGGAVSFSFSNSRCYAYFPRAFQLLTPNFIVPVGKATITSIERELQKVWEAMNCVADMYQKEFLK